MKSLYMLNVSISPLLRWIYLGYAYPYRTFFHPYRRANITPQEHKRLLHNVARPCIIEPARLKMPLKQNSYHTLFRPLLALFRTFGANLRV